VRVRSVKKQRTSLLLLLLQTASAAAAVTADYFKAISITRLSQLRGKGPCLLFIHNPAVTGVVKRQKEYMLWFTGFTSTGAARLWNASKNVGKRACCVLSQPWCTLFISLCHCLHAELCGFLDIQDDFFTHQHSLLDYAQRQYAPDSSENRGVSASQLD
jgi:hypothetical protein